MEKLCLFCTHFRWTAEEMWGMGSELTGPMFEGGWAECEKKHFGQWGSLEKPEDEKDFREVVIKAMNCKDYNQVQTPPASPPEAV